MPICDGEYIYKGYVITKWLDPKRRRIVIWYDGASRFRISKTAVIWTTKQSWEYLQYRAERIIDKRIEDEDKARFLLANKISKEIHKMTIEAYTSRYIDREVAKWSEKTGYCTSV